MLQHSKGLELDPSAILGHVEEGIQAAIGVGVFTCPGNHLQQPVPSWKKNILPEGAAQIWLGKQVCTLALLHH